MANWVQKQDGISKVSRIKWIGISEEKYIMVHNISCCSQIDSIHLMEEINEFEVIAIEIP